MQVADYIKTLKPYEGGKPIEELQRELNLNCDIIKLASNENPLGASKKAVEAIKNTVENINMYPDGDSYYLKLKLSKLLGVSSKNLIFGNGSDELLELIYKVFANEKDDEILYCYPTFIEYRILGKSYNKKLIELPLKDFKYDIDALTNAINSNTKIIFLNTPNNPTGTLIKYEEIELITEKAGKNCLVVVDEAYYEYCKNSKDYKEILDLYKKDNVIILRTFSKAYGLAGLRIGYGIANEKIIDYLNRVRPPFNVNILAQNGALAALDDVEHIKNSVDNNEEGKAYLYNEFEDMGIEYVKTYANFILFDSGKDAEFVYNELLKKSVIIRSMTGYGYKNYLRVTIGTKEENRIFIEKLREVLDV